MNRSINIPFLALIFLSIGSLISGNFGGNELIGGQPSTQFTADFSPSAGTDNVNGLDDMQTAIFVVGAGMLIASPVMGGFMAIFLQKLYDKWYERAWKQGMRDANYNQLKPGIFVKRSSLFSKIVTFMGGTILGFYAAMSFLNESLVPFAISDAAQQAIQQ